VCGKPFGFVDHCHQQGAHEIVVFDNVCGDRPGAGDGLPAVGTAHGLAVVNRR
jgi:hypothetical protein